LGPIEWAAATAKCAVGKNVAETFTRRAGSRSDGTGSVFADTGFDTAYGLAFDSAGNLYVSKFRSSTIEKFSSDGTNLGVFASTGLSSPHGMIFDRAGNLYVANNLNARSRSFPPTGVI